MKKQKTCSEKQKQALQKRRKNTKKYNKDYKGKGSEHKYIFFRVLHHLQKKCDNDIKRNTKSHQDEALGILFLMG